MSKPSPQDLIQIFEPISKVDEQDINYLIQNSDLRVYPPGEMVFEPESPSDYMVFILSGTIRVYAVQQNQSKEITILKSGDITGLLPYSRLKTAKAYAQVQTETRVLAFHRDAMPELIRNHYSLTEALVHHMSSRIRNFTKIQQQNEKMMALGKLSAGLAHELNNPASAIVRSSKALQSHLKSLPENFKKVISVKMLPEQVDQINALLFEKIKEGIKKRFTLLEMQSLEDELADCLEEKGIEDGYDLAENLIEFGFNCEDLEKIYITTGPSHFPPIIKWIDDNLSTEKMVMEIEDASSRIASLVNSVKNFTHMDQTPDKVKTDIHSGIDNTLIMLNHKVKKNQVKIDKDYDEGLENPKIIVSQMNQVWTNLIDNAIDAMEGVTNPVLQISTRQENEFIKTIIRDNGSGISEEIQSKIFDPFYTTKAIGKGTGMGLDVVKNIVEGHNGSIKLRSEQGKTEFEVCIPID